MKTLVMPITLLTLLLTSCKKSESSLIQEYCNTSKIVDSRYLFSEIKKRNIKPELLSEAFSKNESIEIKKKLLDLSFGLDSSASLDVIRDTDWINLGSDETKKVMWGDRSDSIRELEKKYGRKLKEEMKPEEYQFLYDNIALMK